MRSCAWFIVVFILGFLLACSSNSSSNSSSPAETAELSGKELYVTYCVACHGADGKMAFSGAKDLSMSTMDIETRILQITHGKGVMNAFKNVLSVQEIESVAIYIEELRKP
jgi:mono/diheme cytochrome c family protein